LLGESPHLARRLTDAAPCLDRPLAVTGLPYGYVHRAAEEDMALMYRVGDQMGVIPSLAGDGIAIALRSGRQAATDRLAGLSASAYHRRLRADLVRPVGLAGLIHRLCLSRHKGWAVAASRAMPGVIGVLAAWTRSEAALR
jgi:flavin-dependent dehydrogenase